MSLYDYQGTLISQPYLKSGAGATSAYNKAGAQIWSAATDWSSIKWVVVGDSLTDPSINATHKYHAVLSDLLPFARVTVLGKGGTGYWRGSDSNTCFYQRMTGHIPADTNLITIYGSVNDWRWQTEGLTLGTINDTLADGTYAGYVNEALNVAQSQAPNATIIMIGTPYFTKNINYQRWRQATAINRQIAEARNIPFYDQFASTCAGHPTPEHASLSIVSNPFLYDFAFNLRSKAIGLNYFKTNNADFAAIYDMSNAKGHPSNAYHAEYIAPLFANYICEVLNISKTTLPPTLTLEDGATSYVDDYPHCTSISITPKQPIAIGDTITPNNFTVTSNWTDNTSYTDTNSVIDQVSRYVSTGDRVTGTSSITVSAFPIYYFYGNSSPLYCQKTSYSP